LKKFDNHEMWNFDPRMQPFKEIVQYSHLPGWPGPADRRSSESLAKYVIADMFAGAASGKSTKEVIATATGQLKQIYGAG
jgi:multiple sugar transport system substrate-binding protein